MKILVAPMAVGMLAALMWSGMAVAELRFDRGQWRTELSGWGGLEHRAGDVLATGTIDYEVPATPRLTLGLRMMPVLVYAQENDATVWGGGAGLTLRLYQVPEERRGLFGEVQANVIGHDRQFEGNGSNLNFLSGAGIGYQFRNRWHAVLKCAHISNAAIEKDNEETNVIGLGIGYSF